MKDTSEPPEQPLKQRLERRVDRVRDIASTPAAKRWGAVLKYALLAGICALIAMQILRIGWTEVLSNLPVSPWFYVFFVAQFAALPLQETVLYGWLWRRNLWPQHLVFWRKRVLNMTVADASGEAYLGLWASRRLGMPLAEAAKTVKDVTVTFAAAGFVLNAVLIGGLWAAGAFERAGVDTAIVAPIATASAIGLAIVIVALPVYRRIFHAPGPVLLGLGVMHVVRMLVVGGFICAQWAAAIPSGGVEAWLVFFALYFALQRIPLIPGKQALFVGAGLFLADAIDAAPEAVAGMLIAWAALPQIANAALYLVSMRLDAAQPKADAAS